MFRLRSVPETTMPGKPLNETESALAAIDVHWRLKSLLSLMAIKAKFRPVMSNPKSPTPAKALTLEPVKASISTLVVLLSESVTSRVDFSKAKKPLSLTKLKRLISSEPDARSMAPFMSSVTTVEAELLSITPPIPDLTGRP